MSDAPAVRRFAPLITCEHAAADVPPDVALGVDGGVLRTHVSYDRGAREIAVELARALEAPLHLGRYTRLLVDLNRMEENPAALVEETYGVRVPGNAGLDAEAREARIARFHRPYRHAARADALRLARAAGCLHLSVHSFDPSLDPAARCFDAGVLFDPAREPERTIAEALAAGLSACGHEVRLNAPYAGTPEGLTSWLRAQIEPERYAGVEIEACYRWMDRPGSHEAFARDLAAVVRAVTGT